MMASKISRIAFCLYIIVMLIGTAPPFQYPEPDDELGGSNPINQVVHSVIPLVCLLCLWPARSKALELLKQEKYLTLFLVWCAVTVMWSDFPLASLKAAVRMMGAAIVALAFFVHARSAEDALRYVKAALAVYIPLTFLSIAFVPEATQWEWPAWRGLTRHKNTLGEIALISTIIWAAGIHRASGRGRLWSTLLALASVILLIGSQSVTAWMTLAILTFMVLGYIVARSLGPVVAASAAGCSCVLGLMLMVNVATLDDFFEGLGRDSTFTGRTAVWQEMIDEAKTHPFLGAGFGGFWTDERPLTVYTDDSSWKPSSGHQGYLDIWNETGIIGAGLLVLMLLFYFRNATRLPDSSHIWVCLVIVVLLINSMESTLFRSGSFIGWIFLLSYLALYSDLAQRKTA